MITPTHPALLGVAALLGCASRTAPATHGGAASPDARSAPVIVVTRALDGEPPPPGQDEAGWPGLHAGDSAPPAAHDHAEHAAPGHGGHDHAGAHPSVPIESDSKADNHAGHGGHTAPAPAKTPGHEHGPGRH